MSADISHICSNFSELWSNSEHEWDYCSDVTMRIIDDILLISQLLNPDFGNYENDDKSNDNEKNTSIQHCNLRCTTALVLAGMWNRLALTNPVKYCYGSSTRWCLSPQDGFFSLFESLNWHTDFDCLESMWSPIQYDNEVLIRWKRQ